MEISPLVIEITKNEVSVRRSNSLTSLICREVLGDTTRPVLKWAGGKGWIAGAARAISPPTIKRYYEPFLGGGAFFLALMPDDALLSDANEDLIETYQAIKEHPDAVIRHLQTYPYEKEFYYRMRKSKPRSAAARAARFVYLNRTCWNGLYRVNRLGEFNTPFGKLRNPTVCNRDRILKLSSMLTRKELVAEDFEHIANKVTRGDFVYFDPPYITGHQDNGFLKYNKRLFSWEDQTRLARLGVELAKKGVFVLVSNADHRSVVSLYEGFNYYRMSRKSLIAGKIACRTVTSEALLSSYPILDQESPLIS